MAKAAVKEMNIERTETFCDHVFGGFCRMKSDGKFTDISIHSNGTTFHCHRVVLAASSPVLEAMMLSGMAEAEKKEINLDSIPSLVVEHLIEYMYTGKVDLPDELLQPTLRACDFLSLKELKRSCFKRSMIIVNASSAISWFSVANELGHDELRSRCSTIMALSLVQVASGTEFLELPLAEVSSYLTDAQSTIDIDDVLDAAMAWVDYKRDTRQDHLTHLLQNLDLSGCSIQCLDDQNENHRALLDSQPSASCILKKAKEKVSEKEQELVRMNRSRSTLVVLGGHSDEYRNHKCWYRDHESQKLELLCDLPEKWPEWLSVCSIPGGFVVTGGTASDMCVMFLAATKSWTTLQSLRETRSEHASINIENKIFVLGGRVAGKESRTVHSLKLDGDEWVEEPDLPDSVCDPEVAGIDRTMFLLNPRRFELYQKDPESKKWKRKDHYRGMYFYDARMTSARDRLYILGGRKIFCCYDPVTGTWTHGAAPKLHHHFGALLCCNDKLILIGGRGEDGAEEYDFATESWSVCDFTVPYRNNYKLYNLYAVSVRM